MKKRTVEIQDYTIVFDAKKITVIGPDDATCDLIATNFLGLLNTGHAEALLKSHEDSSSKLADILGLPSRTHRRRLAKLIGWLNAHVEELEQIEEALEPLGYSS